MKFVWILAASAALVAGCGNNSNSGGSSGHETPPVTGRGSGERGDSGGNGKVYDRGGAPDSANPSSQETGSGRIDTGGGVTAGGKVNDSAPTHPNGTNSP